MFPVNSVFRLTLLGLRRFGLIVPHPGPAAQGVHALEAANRCPMIHFPVEQGFAGVRLLNPAAQDGTLAKPTRICLL